MAFPCSNKEGSQRCSPSPSSQHWLLCFLRFWWVTYFLCFTFINCCSKSCGRMGPRSASVLSEKVEFTQLTQALSPSSKKNLQLLSKAKEAKEWQFSVLVPTKAFPSSILLIQQSHSFLSYILQFNLNMWASLSSPACYSDSDAGWNSSFFWLGNHVLW